LPLLETLDSDSMQVPVATRSLPQSAPPFGAGLTRASKLTLPRIVTIGGGTGQPVVLRGLVDALQQMLGPRDLTRWADAITAIVTVTGDGRSPGATRDMSVLSLGDIRNCLAVLSSSAAFERLLQHRFDTATELPGHAVGNVMLAALTQMTGNCAAAAEELARLLRARGRVYPSTLDEVTLAELKTDSLGGNTASLERPTRVRRVALAGHARPLPEVLRALVNADAIVVGPASLYGSVLPSLLVDGVAPTLSAVRGVRIYVANLLTPPDAADVISVGDHLRILREHVGRDLFDYVLVNSTPLTPLQLARYAGTRTPLLAYDNARAGSAKVVAADLLDPSSDPVRHDSEKLAAAIVDIIRRGR
jgi:uncharacterized cofD-like protein